MKETLLTRRDMGLGEEVFDSIAWALEQHCKILDAHVFNSAVLYGNEDAPDQIDFYLEADPLITSTVAWRWKPELYADQ